MAVLRAETRLAPSLRCWMAIRPGGTTEDAPRGVLGTLRLHEGARSGRQGRRLQTVLAGFDSLAYLQPKEPE